MALCDVSAYDFYIVCRYSKYRIIRRAGYEGRLYDIFTNSLPLWTDGLKK